MLLIACANVANLLMVRAAARKREIAIRAAIGAGRGRIIRQLLTESIVLSTIGGILGLVLGMIGIRALLAVNPGNIPRIGADGSGVGVDWRVLAFTAIVSLLTGIVFGLFPALRASRADLSTTLKESGGLSGAGVRHNKARALLVVSELALALVLLVGAALFIRTFAALRAVKPGFDASQVLTMRMSLTGGTVRENGRRGASDSRRGRTAERAAGRRGRRGHVLRAAAGRTGVTVRHRRPRAYRWAISRRRRVQPDFGDLFQRVQDSHRSRPRLHGSRYRRSAQRGDHQPGDGANSSGRTAIRSPTASRSPKVCRQLEDPTRQIVGIVGDVRAFGLNQDPRPIMYIPWAQVPDAHNANLVGITPLAWIVRTRGEPYSLSAAIQTELRQASGGLPVARPRTMDEIVTQSTARSDFNMFLLTIFAGSALLLAAIGIYGLMAYSVQQRTQEIGIRLALGAEPHDVRNMVIRQGMSVALVGVAIGLASAFGLTRFIASFLFGVTRPGTRWCSSAVPLLLSAVALVGVWLPARRAARVDPVIALRTE